MTNDRINSCQNYLHADDSFPGFSILVGNYNSYVTSMRDSAVLVLVSLVKRIIIATGSIAFSPARVYMKIMACICDKTRNQDCDIGA